MAKFVGQSHTSPAIAEATEGRGRAPVKVIPVLSDLSNRQPVALKIADKRLLLAAKRIEQRTRRERQIITQAPTQRKGATAHSGSSLAAFMSGLVMLWQVRLHTLSASSMTLTQHTISDAQRRRTRPNASSQCTKLYEKGTGHVWGTEEPGWSSCHRLPRSPSPRPCTWSPALTRKSRTALFLEKNEEIK